MAAYFLFDNLTVADPAALEQYKRLVGPVVEQFGGRYVAIGGPTELLEGAWTPTHPVLIEFPTAAQARAWYHSDVYRALKALRLSAVRSNAVLIEGL